MLRIRTTNDNKYDLTMKTKTQQINGTHIRGEINVSINTNNITEAIKEAQNNDKLLQFLKDHQIDQQQFIHLQKYAEIHTTRKVINVKQGDCIKYQDKQLQINKNICFECDQVQSVHPYQHNYNEIEVEMSREEQQEIEQEILNTIQVQLVNQKCHQQKINELNLNYLMNLIYIIFDEPFVQSEELSSGQQAGYWIASFCSGSNIGLLSIDPVQFETIRREGSEQEQKACQKLRFFMKNRHLTLCSILIMNSACMEVLPILLTALVGDLISLLLSITLILLFGELIPQIICGTLSVLLWIFVVLTFIVSKPLSLLLDKMLGSNQAHFLQRREIAAFCMQHANDKSELSKSEQSDQDDSEDGKVLQKQEAQQLNQLILLKDQTVDNYLWMVPFQKVYTISSDTIVNKQFLNSLLQVKFSRYPVYSGDKNNIIGTLHIKSLFKMKLDQPLDQDLLHPILKFDQNLTFFRALEQFQTGKNHMAIVLSNTTQKPIGIVTLESLLQKLIIADDEEIFQ